MCGSTMKLSEYVYVSICAWETISLPVKKAVIFKFSLILDMGSYT